MKSRLILLPLAAFALLASCGGKTDEKPKSDTKKQAAKQDNPPNAPAADAVAGTWELDVAALKQQMFEQAKAAGQVPADATLDDPAIDAQFGVFDETKMTVTVNADGTWTSQASGGPNGESESAAGSWKKTAAGYEFTRSTINGEAVEDAPATVTLDGDAMTLTMPNGMSMTLNRA